MTDQRNDDKDSTGHNIIVAVVGGLPGSGKSTLVQKLAATLSENADVFNEVHTIDYDEIQQSLLDSSLKHSLEFSGDPSLEAWRKSRSVALDRLGRVLEDRMADDFQLPMNPRVQNTLIMLDDNFHLRSMRKQVHQICQSVMKSPAEQSSTSIYFVSIWLDTPIETCFIRNSKRPEETRVSNESIQRISDSSETPQGGRENWEINNKILDGGDNTSLSTNLSLLSDFLHQISIAGSSKAVRPPISLEEDQERLERERVATLGNRSHQLDQMSRSWIKAVAKIRPQSAKSANLVRKEMLNEKERLLQCEDDLAKLFVERLLKASQVEWSSAQKTDLMLQLSLT